jgi:putative ABC transport system permease protein
LFGVLAALPFVLWPLGHVTTIRAAELLRETIEGAHAWPPRRFRIATALAVTALAGAAIFFSAHRQLALLACAGLFAIFALFWGAGTLARRLAAGVKRPRQPELALALANMGGPGSLTRIVALSLGGGLTLLTTISLVDASLTADLRERLPEKAPSHFFIGIPKDALQDFETLVRNIAPGAQLEAAPMLRGRLIELHGTPVSQIKAPDDAKWVLNGDRGLTFSPTLPRDSRIVAGEWWPPDYQGEPLVSFAAELAGKLGLKLGDTVTVNVLGRNVTARIANLREVKWETLGINFVMIFSPNTLKAAPYTYLATLNWPENLQRTDEAEGQIIRAVASAYPAVTAVRVRDAINAIDSMLERIMLAIRVASSVTLLMGAIVLASALITAQQSRTYEAVILKTLGATRVRILLSHFAEHLMLAFCLSLLAGALSIVIAYAVTTQIMDLSFSLSVRGLLQPPIFATIFLIALGAAGTFRILSARPAFYLRSE